jgi:small-conductance mechanosensitive channel
MNESSSLANLFTLMPDFLQTSQWQSLFYVILLISLLRIIYRVLARFQEKADKLLTREIIDVAKSPLLTLIGLAGIRAISEPFLVNENITDFINHSYSIVSIAIGSWLVWEIVQAASDVFLSKYDVSVADNYRARKIHTQFRVLTRLAHVLIVIITLSLILMTFDGVETIGTSLLASAGVTGIIIGFAAQKTLGTVVAGIQIAITQPIKIDDAVVVEGEWGWIEEITFTYVVIRIWDLRRLIVPITYFIEKPFQNWTRKNAEIIGTVYIHTDYRLPVVELRKELEKQLNETELWNGNVCNLQVVETQETTMTFRALMTAENSPKTWDLRCHIREKLIGWIAENHPDSLPRTRVLLGESSEENSRSKGAL